MNEEELVEWAILIALFRATCEQQSMLIGVPRQKAKQVFSRWIKEGENLLKIVEKNSNPQKLEALTEMIEGAVNDIRILNQTSKQE